MTTIDAAEATRLAGAVRREGHALAAAARRAPDAAIPSCPGWDMTTLLNHLGRVHGWAATAVESRATEAAPFPKRPDAVTVEWFEAGVDHLADVLDAAAATPDAPVWNFMGVTPADAGFWIRRQAVETAIHRWDAQLAAGDPEPIEPALAVAGIDEALLLHLTLAAAALENDVDLGGTVHFHATDTTDTAGDADKGEWTVRLDGRRLVVGRGHEKGDVAARGTASDLLLFLWGRVDQERLEVFGDGTILERWQGHLRIA
ncbi:MAG TPA: maleylpyruvate isomerase family mycothiol-dependent enzyme [Acidimicrobiales bacterium]|nr:maleylpyruvate isomerase family mycothiol-dependent enzyme [Acidimicrobiales bacterium]